MSTARLSFDARSLSGDENVTSLRGANQLRHVIDRDDMSRPLESVEIGENQILAHNDELMKWKCDFRQRSLVAS